MSKNFPYDASGPHGFENDTQALCIYQQVGMPKYIQFHSAKLVNHYMRMKKYDSAMKYIEIGMDSCKTGVNKFRKGFWLGNMAASLLYLNKPEQSLDYGIQAYRAFLAEGNHKGMETTTDLFEQIISVLRNENAEYLRDSCEKNEFLKEIHERFKTS